MSSSVSSISKIQSTTRWDGTMSEANLPKPECLQDAI